MKLVFLDVDGVLNSTAYLLGPPRKPTLHEEGISRSMVEHLNLLLRATGAKVVISSTWRCYVPLPKLVEMLERRGFQGEVIGQTPDMPGMDRGVEIEAWLEAYDENPEGEDIEAFVIIDDNADMEPHMARLVQTDAAFGLTSAEVTEAFRVLEGR